MKNRQMKNLHDTVIDVRSLPGLKQFYWPVCNDIIVTTSGWSVSVVTWVSHQAEAAESGFHADLLL